MRSAYDCGLRISLKGMARQEQKTISVRAIWATHVQDDLLSYSDFLSTRVFAKQKGAWKVVAFQSTRVTTSQ
jgi:hypothetical protein